MSRTAGRVLIFLLLLAQPSFAQTPNEPFKADAHTLLLYHFDEGQGMVARDAGKHTCDGEVQGAAWAAGKFGQALRFDGKDDCVYRKLTPAISGLKQITVECWFKQDDSEGRQFLIGRDVTFHHDLSSGSATSISLYNKGGKLNADGLRHQQVGTALGYVRPEKWHHIAATYDGQRASFFLDGVLKGRQIAPEDFLLGDETKGLWVGCYVGKDYWFSGLIDEVRVSDCVRYDPGKKLKEGGRAFEMPERQRLAKAVRKPVRTGLARLNATLRKLYGENAAGWVYLKPPGKRASIVGAYELKGLADKAEQKLDLDVSDEVTGDGCYIFGLEPTDTGAYFEVTSAALSSNGKEIGRWTGQAKSRRTFKPPILLPLQVGAHTEKKPIPLLLLPHDVDRLVGDIAIEEAEGPGSPRIAGDGCAEFWLDIPAEAAWRVHLRYAASRPRPCDIVVDGEDLNPYNMCARNKTGSFRERDAFWEFQGTATLTAGLHWFRIQDMPPDVFAIRLEPAPPAKKPVVPWERYPVPDDRFLSDAASWQPRLDFACDLEPFGRLRFRFEGRGSGRVIALRLVDVKGDEKLLWRARDTKPWSQEIAVPIAFEGNDVFDPAHVVAIRLDLDEDTAQAKDFAGAITGLVFDRRDVLASPEEPVAFTKNVPGAAAPLLAPPHSPWTKPVVPEEHPLYTSTNPKPVTRKTMGHTLHLTGARGISEKTLDDFHKHYDFGDVCWPHIGILPQRKNFKSEADYQKALRDLEERLNDVRSRGLYLFDIWGYVPYDPRFPYTASPDHHAILMRVFGDRFLGYDNGEQDGRYIGSYASRGKAATRRQGWDDFVEWDTRVCNDGMNYMNATGSLNFSHYYGERACRLLGLETAQGLPSDTLMFAFLRGAAKQYGRLTYQAASIWNRYGYNLYGDRKTESANGYGYGPNKGCSRSLHKRLFFCGWLEGQSIFGTETGQFTADRLENGAPELSALGRQHLELKAWAQKHPDRGVMYTPVAFMLDFHNGWNMPRHLYRQDRYKVWGKFPYEKGDYLIDAIFRMVWPGYEDCSYFRNERGFITPTPFGDIFDVITNRCHPEVLRQYAAIMLLGDVEMSTEVVKNLTSYVQAGGDLILDARHAKAFPEAFAGVRPGATERVNESGHPLITARAQGKGRVIVCAADYWMTDALTYRTPEIINMEPPYTILKGARAALAQYLDSFSPVEIAPKGLTIRTCFFDKDPQRLLVGLINNDLFADWRGVLRLRKGEVASVTDLRKDLPLPAAREIPLTIPAGDVAIVELRLR